MRLTLTILLIALMSLSVGAQKTEAPAAPDKVGFNSIHLNKVGKFEANIKTKNTLKSMRNGVDITIKGKTPEENINIVADTILFSYASKEDSQPSVMKLSGNIRIKNSEFLIECNKATINIATQKAQFTEVKRVEHPDIGLMKADEITYNFDTGDLGGTNLESIESEAETEAATKAP